MLPIVYSLIWCRLWGWLSAACQHCKAALNQHVRSFRVSIRLYGVGSSTYILSVNIIPTIYKSLSFYFQRLVPQTFRRALQHTLLAALSVALRPASQPRITYSSPSVTPSDSGRYIYIYQRHQLCRTTILFVSGVIHCSSNVLLWCNGMPSNSIVTSRSLSEYRVLPI